MDVETVTRMIVAAVPSFIGFLALRSIKGIDYSIDRLGAKIDTLAATDTEIKIELARLQVRVTGIEAQLKGFEFSPPQRRSIRRKAAAP